MTAALAKYSRQPTRPDDARAHRIQPLSDEDSKAVDIWLAARANRSPHTLDSYRRQADRLLDWLAWQNKTIRSLSVEDAIQHLKHLSDPPQDWIRPRRGPALQHQRLKAPLNLRSLVYARTVLVQMFNYLRECSYVPVNVFLLTPKAAAVPVRMQDRHLDLEAWDHLWTWVTCRTPYDHEGETPESLARDRWLLALLYHTGLRREEVSRATWGDFVKDNGNWLMRVIGKGNKERLVTCNSSLTEEMRRYRMAQGLPPHPSPADTDPVVHHLRNHRHGNLTARAIGLMIESIREKSLTECSDPHIRDRISRMSTHWMRHTNATHRLQAGADLMTTQEELGHASIDTTRLYAATEKEHRRDDAEKLAQLGTKKQPR